MYSVSCGAPPAALGAQRVGAMPCPVFPGPEWTGPSSSSSHQRGVGQGLLGAQNSHLGGSTFKE